MNGSGRCLVAHIQPAGAVAMNPDLTEIACILDRSGSMESIRDDAIGGFNTFIDNQKKLPGEARLTLVLFDNEYLIVEDGTPLGQIKPLDHSTFVPRGPTALYDAVGRTINDLGARLAKMPDADRPGKVIVVILTDGQENSSHEFSQKNIFDMIQKQQTTYSWEFLFLAANQDALAAAESIAIKQDNAINFEASPKGVQFAMHCMSANIENFRNRKT